MTTRRRRLLAAALAVSMAAATSACHGSADEPSLGWRELHDLSPYEVAALADKHISREELASSVQHLTDCYAGHGIRVVDGEFQTPGEVLALYDVSTDAESARLEAAERRCRTEVSAIDAVWILQEQLTPVEQEKAKRDSIDCLRAAGVRVPGGASFEAAWALATEGSDSAVDRIEVDRCARKLTTSLQTALPGLAEALEELATDPSTSVFGSRGGG